MHREPIVEALLSMSIAMSLLQALSPTALAYTAISK
jgi:hypothetical protein